MITRVVHKLKVEHLIDADGSRRARYAMLCQNSRVKGVEELKAARRLVHHACVKLRVS